MLLLKILGFLLKAIGILLLTVLALIVFLLLIVLFVPIRYRAKITREGENLTVKAQISWLGSILRVPVIYQEGALDYRAKVLWFTVFPRKKSAEKADAKQQESGEPVQLPDGTESVRETQMSETVPKPEAQILEDVQAEEGTGTGKATQISESAQIAEVMQASEPAQLTDEAKESETISEVEEMAETEENGPIGRLLRRLQQFIAKIKSKYQSFVERITETKNRIKQKLTDIKEKVQGLKNRISDVLAFLKMEDTQIALKLTGKSIFQLIKYILPYKIKGEVIFGTGDPYSMGQALSVLGIFYGVYARTLQVTADFETTEFRLDGNIALKGRIRLARVFYILLRLWFKGRLKQVIANAKGLIPG